MLKTLTIAGVLAALLSPLACDAPAEPALTHLRGKVVDPLGQGIHHVTIRRQGDGQSVQSQVDGSYRLTVQRPEEADLSHSNVVLTYDAVGYYDGTQRIQTLGGQEQIIADITLLPKPPSDGIWHLDRKGLHLLRPNPIFLTPPLGLPNIDGKVVNLGRDYDAWCLNTPLFVAGPMRQSTDTFLALDVQDSPEIRIGGGITPPEIPLIFRHPKPQLALIESKYPNTLLLLMGGRQSRRGMPMIYALRRVDCGVGQ